MLDTEIIERDDEGLTLLTSAKHHIPQATNTPYQPLLIKPIFSVLAHAEKQFFFKTSLPVFIEREGWERVPLLKEMFVSVFLRHVHV